MKRAVTSTFIFFALCASAQLEPIKQGVHKWEDFEVRKGNLKEGRKIFEGESAHFKYFKMHSTTQLPGAKPSEAHANEDAEECIIVTEGKMKITIEGESKVLGPEGVILLMPQQMHSIENVGETNLTYYVMKYKARKKMDLDRGQSEGGSYMISADSLTFKPSSKGGSVAYFDRPTAMCERFEMHITELNKKGPSHKPHKHIETEIILILKGSAEMDIDGIEYKAKAGDFYLANSWSTHGIRNATDEICRYFAFKWN